MDVPDSEFEQLRSLESLGALSEDDALVTLAKLADGADERNLADCLHTTIRLGVDFLARDLSANGEVNAHYCVSNAWASLNRISHRGTDQEWNWKLPEHEGQLRHLRLAVRSIGLSDVVAGRRTQIYTNMGNLLSHLGRPAEAVAQYHAALCVFPGFAMATGNRGIALCHLARAHYDPGQAKVILHSAYQSLMHAAWKSSDLEPGVTDYFEQWRFWIHEQLPTDFLNKPNPAKEFSLGRSKAERAYRQWCLTNTLFLNPMNDAGPMTVAATDTVLMPSHVLELGAGPGFFGLFNQIKQEFAAARFLFWEGMQSSKRHFADREVLLMDTLDYPAYCMAIEKQRIAFRMAYSILDKVAFLLNKYLSLGLKDDVVNLNRLWFKDGNPKKGLSIDLVNGQNWPLRGLFWLARDLFDERGLAEAVDPDARDLKDIRNHLEHKYLKVHDDLWHGQAGDKSGRITDQFAHSIRRSDFEAKSKKMLTLARSAILYSALAIHQEEKLRAAKRNADEITPPMTLPTVIDEWKR